MDPSSINKCSSKRLSDLLSDWVVPTPHPLKISPWLAMSLLQKAIRRGDESFALDAAATLLRDAPDRLWRRCSVIVFEDVGVGDLTLAPSTISLTSGKEARTQLGSDWAIASLIVSKLAHAPKCRAADDLMAVCEHHPSYEGERRRLAMLTTAELLRVVAGEADLITRALALWYALGTGRHRSEQLVSRWGDPQAVFSHLGDAGIAPALIEAARVGHRKTGEPLGPFICLLGQAVGGSYIKKVDDEFPPETLIGDVPGWALDMFTREGRAAIRQLLSTKCESARWAQDHLPQSERIDFLGGVLFRVEGGLMRSRLSWSVGSDLRHKMDMESNGPHCPDASEIIALLNNDIPMLNQIRGEQHV